MKSLRRWSLNGPSHRYRLKSTQKKQIHDPHELFLQRWNKIFLLSCVVAVFLDPLFLYIPVVDYDKLCLDQKLKITACILRSFIDIFYIFRIFFQLRTGFMAARIHATGLLVRDSRATVKRYMCSYFIVDILSILPLPQVLSLTLLSTLRGPFKTEALTLGIFAQYIPRFLRIYPLYKEVTRASGMFTEMAWAGAALNFFLYMLASHVIGAYWYLIAVERMERCWRRACHEKIVGCHLDDLYCRGSPYNTSSLFYFCSPHEPADRMIIDFGIFFEAIQSQDYRDFPRRFLYCFLWGLKNLSSFGQSLKTSGYFKENIFAVSISVIGLILFCLVFGNMQKFFQSFSVRQEEMMEKRRDQEQWMSRRMLPEELRVRVRRYEQYKWREDRGVEEESLIRNLPKDLRRDIKRHLYRTLLTRVPMFEKLDKQLLNALCSRLKAVLYNANSIIICEGDPVDEMLFITKGKILSTTIDVNRSTGFFNAVSLKAGDFCGEELLTWALDPNPSSILPISTRTVQAIKDVKAFSLMPDDLKCVVSQFKHLHSEQLQHIFRFYSQQWRTWGACIIQATWRRYYRRKIEKSLKEAEDGLQAARYNGGKSPSLVAAIYASRFATNMIGNLRRRAES